MGDVFDDILSEQGATQRKPDVFDEILSGNSGANSHRLGAVAQGPVSAGGQGAKMASMVSAAENRIADNPGGGRMVEAQVSTPAAESQSLGQTRLGDVGSFAPTHSPVNERAASTLDEGASRAIQENEGGGRIIRTAGGRKRYSDRGDLEEQPAKPIDNRSNWEKRDTSKDNFAQRLFAPVMARNEFQYKNADELSPEKQQEQLNYLFSDTNPDSYDASGTPDYTSFISKAQHHGYDGKTIKKFLDTSSKADIPLAPTGDGFSGGVAEVGRAGARGLAKGTKMVAQSGQWFTPSSMEEEGIFKDAVDRIEAVIKRNPQLFAESEKNKDRSWYNPMKAVVGGTEMVSMMAPGMVMPGGVAGQFWGAMAQEKYDELAKKKPGMSEAKKIAYATGEGIVQGGLEWLQTKIPAGVLGKFIPGKAKGDIIRRAAGMVKTGKGKLLGTLGVAYLGELATETSQDMGSKELDYFSGLEKEGVSLRDIGESLKVNAGPVLFTTFALSGPAHIADNRRREQIKSVLTASPEIVSRQDRIAAVKAVYDSVAESDKSLANEWLKEALPMAEMNRPLAIPTDDKYLNRKPDPGALERNRAVLDLKKQNLPTRDLLEMKNNPTDGGVSSSDIDLILEERYGEMGEMWDALDSEMENDPIGRAATGSIRDALNELIGERAAERDRAQKAADRTAMDQGLAEYNPEAPFPESSQRKLFSTPDVSYRDVPVDTEINSDLSSESGSTKEPAQSLDNSELDRLGEDLSKSGASKETVHTVQAVLSDINTADPGRLAEMKANIGNDLGNYKELIPFSKVFERAISKREQELSGASTVATKSEDVEAPDTVDGKQELAGKAYPHDGGFSPVNINQQDKNLLQSELANDFMDSSRLVQDAENAKKRRRNFEKLQQGYGSDVTGQTNADEDQVQAVGNKASVAHGQDVNVNPSDAQKKAENYKKAHVRLDGMDISIENPAGSTRSGTDKSGRQWSQKMKHDYGYFKGTVGFDKDHVDVFFKGGYKGGAKKVYIVNQYDGNKFDEHKVIIGDTTKAGALKTYNANYEKGWKGGKDVVEMSMDDFKEWVKSDAPKQGPAVGKVTLGTKKASKPGQVTKKLTKRQREIMNWLNAGNSFKDFDIVPEKKQPIDTGYRPSPKVIGNLINKGLIEFLPNHGENGEWYSVKVIERDNMRKVDTEITRGNEKPNLTLRAEAQEALSKNLPKETTNQEDFILAPGGGLDFGEISREQANLMRRQAGKIRLQQGRDDDTARFGLVHIEKSHANDLPEVKEGNVPDLVKDIATNFNEIWSAYAGQLLLVKRNGSDKIAYIQLKPSEDADFYTVNTVFRSRKHKGKELLWSATHAQAGSTDKNPDFAENPNKAGGEAPNVTPESKSSVDNVSSKHSQVKTDQRETPTGDKAVVTTQNEGPDQAVADNVKTSLEQHEKITYQQLFKWADDAYGGTQGENKYTPKDAYDALELGINQYIDSTAKLNPSATENPSAALNLLAENVMSLIPTQSKRTEEMDEFQQFSTPPPLAYMANWVAKPQKGETYLEPSAGVGGIAVFGKNSGANVVVNELSDRRRGLIRQMGFDRVFGENAEHLNSILPADVKPTVIVMNPPFSATAGRIQGKRATQVGAQHVEQALKRLEPGGRLVAIVGEGMAMDKPSFSGWWNKIKDEYNVRANIGLSGKGYRKYGTTFDNQMLVIDKTGQTTDNIVTGKVDSPADLVPLLEGIRNDRENVQSRQVEQDSKEKAAGSRSKGRVSGPGPVVSSQPDEMGPGKRSGHEGANDISQHPGAISSVRRSAKDTPVHGDSGQYRGGQPAASSKKANDSKRSGMGAVGRAGDSDKGSPVSVQRSAAEDIPRELRVDVARNSEYSNVSISDSVYEEYKPEKVRVPGAKKHPAPLAQSAAMASVSMPDPSYSPKLPKRTIKSGALSDAQLEAVVYAGQAHTRELPNGERQGFLIGDGTGLGKGREVAGIIWDNWNHGRKKAVWISETSNLFKDAKRDIAGIGWDSDVIFPHSKTKATGSLPTGDGVLFTTYSTLKSSARGTSAKPGKTRLQQIVDWLGKDFDGVIAFDESHNMGNAVPVKGKRGNTTPSKMALAGVELQQLLPKARVVYLSATGATEIQNFSYAERLGLWGEGTAFSNKMSFIDQISSGGTAAMELIARDMKSMGVYLSRSISYDGVEYDRVEHNLSEDQYKMYNTVAGAWQTVLQNINEAIGITGADNRGRAKAMSDFWGANQRFFSQYITTLQMPSVLKSIHDDIKNGDSVVIQLVNTFEAATERGLAKLDEGMSIEDLDISPFDDLMLLVERSFPVTQYETYTDDNGAEKSRPVQDSKGNPVLNADAVKMREQLLDELGSIRGEVADNPLDQILDEFGVDNVAEVTGRKRRVVWVEKDGRKKRVIQKRSKASGRADTQDFMDDKKRILFFSQAGGTGSSYHADNTAINTRKRQHYLLQPGWRADQAVQGLGRTHRSNQKQPPRYRLVTSNLKGQKRFLSSIARRLEQLGALTKGQRQTGNQGIFSERDNLESPYAKDALRKLFLDLDRGRVAGITMGEFEKQTGLNLTDSDTSRLKETLPDVIQFLNRILSMDVDSQNTVFDEFSQRIDAVLAAHAKAGTLDVGMETLNAESVRKVKEIPVYTDKLSGAETRYVKLAVTNPAQRLSFVNSKQYANDGYYQNKISGKTWAVTRRMLTNRKTGQVVDTMVLTSPTYRKQNIPSSEFGEKKWNKLKKTEAKKYWNDDLDSVPATTTSTEHLITGALLPIWDKLSGNPRIMRIQTDDGERMIGRMIPDEALDSVLDALGVDSTGAKTTIDMPAVDVFSNVIDGGDTISLADGTRIERRRVSGENRIEVKGLNRADFHNLEKYGMFSERINYQTRYFVPTTKDGVKIIEKLTVRNPISSVNGRKSSKPAELSVDGDGAKSTPLYSRAGKRLAVLDKKVSATRITLNKAITPQQAKRIYNNKIKGTEQVNNDTGWSIGFSAKGRGKAFSHGRKQSAHLSSIVGLKEIVKNAVLFNTETLREGEKVHTFFSLLDIDGTAYRAKIIVREDGQGRKFYDLSESGIRKSRVPSRLLRAQEHESSPTTPGLSIKTLDDLLSIVNDEFHHYSKNSRSSSGSTVTQASRAVRKFLGKTGYMRWRADRIIRIIDSSKAPPKHTDKFYTPDGKRVAGYYHPNDGSITLIADNIKPEEVEGVLLHEGVHRLLDTDKTFIKDRGNLLASFEALQDGKDRQSDAVKAAFNKARQAEPGGNADLIREEALSYYLQDKANRTLPLYRKIIAAVKRALRRLGIPTGKLTADDIVGIFVAGVKKDAANYNGEKSGASPTSASSIKKSYAGLSSATADKTALDKAVEMYRNDSDIETIRQETGWHLGKDNKWRYEIDDSKASFDFGKIPEEQPRIKLAESYLKEKHNIQAKFPIGDPRVPQKLQKEALAWADSSRKRNTVKLDTVLDHKELFDAYPELRDVNIATETDPTLEGSYNPDTNTVSVSKNFITSTDEDAFKTLLHELQHKIQTIEGFAPGGHPSQFGGNVGKYQKLHGEIEARDTSTRKDLTAEQRRALPPYVSEGIPMEDAIVKFSKVNNASIIKEGFTEDQESVVHQADRVINKDDISSFARVFSSFEYMSRKSKAAWRVMEAQLSRRDNKHIMETNIVGDFNDVASALKKEDEKLYGEFSDYLVDIDRTGKAFSVRGQSGWTVTTPDGAYVGTATTKEKAYAMSQEAAKAHNAKAKINGTKQYLVRDYPVNEASGWEVIGPKGEVLKIAASEKEAVAEMMAAEAKQMAKDKINRKVIRAVMAFRGMTNRAFDEMVADMRRVIAEAEEQGLDMPSVDVVDESRRWAIFGQHQKKPTATFSTRAEAEAALRELSKVQTKTGKRRIAGKPMPAYDIKKQDDSDIMKSITIKEAISLMGDLRGAYFPRTRKPGGIILKAYNKKGNRKFLKKFDFAMLEKRGIVNEWDGTIKDDGLIVSKLKKVFNALTPLGAEIRRLEKQGFEVEVSKDESLPEDVFEATQLMSSVNALLEKSLDAAKKKDQGAHEEAAAELNKILTANIADIFKQRGYLSSRLKRSDDYYEGFETDPIKAGVQYARGLSAGMAKKRAAREMVLALAGRDIPYKQWQDDTGKSDYTEYLDFVASRRIDPGKQKNLYAETMSFIREVLRNEERSDRIMGTLQGLTVLKFLGFRVSSAAVNLTNMVQGVPATMSGHTGLSLTKSLNLIRRSAVEYGKLRLGKSSGVNKAIFDYVTDMGWDEAQFNTDLYGALRSKTEGIYDSVSAFSMLAFGVTEKANRAMTHWAAYKAVMKSQGKKITAEIDESAMKKAHEISDRAHGVYGKETKPAWTRGAWNPLKMAFTFQKFGQNYMLNMLELGFDKKDYKAAAYMLLSPAVLAGAGASIVTPLLASIASGLGIGGDDPEEEFYAWARETFGTDRVFRNGIAGLGGINLKGSLQINMPFPTNMKEMMTTPLISVAGAPGGVIKDEYDAINYLLRGDGMKSLEKMLPTGLGAPIKAYREGTQGITTKGNSPVFYGNKPLKADRTDMVMRAFGFNPAKLSGIRERQWSERKVSKEYSKMKSDISARVKAWMLGGRDKQEWEDILADILKFNERVKTRRPFGVTPITRKTLRRYIRSTTKAPRRERMRRRTV